MSGTYANLEDALKRIAELEEELEKERKIDWDELKCWWCNSRGCDTIQNGNPIHADCVLDKEENICKTCGVHESEECKLDCAYRAMRNAEDEWWDEIEDLLYKQPKNAEVAESKD
jgi:hypothetical protein